MAGQPKDSLMEGVDGVIKAAVFHGQSLTAIATYLEVEEAFVKARFQAMIEAGEQITWKEEYGRHGCEK